MASGGSTMKVFVLALLVVLPMQAVHATGSLRLREVFRANAIAVLTVIRVACFQTSYHERSVSTADTADGLHQGRALLQSNQCPRGVGTQCPPGFWWYCQRGTATQTCRNRSQGRFPNADCERQCLAG